MIDTSIQHYFRLFSLSLFFYFFVSLIDGDQLWLYINIEVYGINSSRSWW